MHDTRHGMSNCTIFTGTTKESNTGVVEQLDVAYVAERTRRAAGTTQQRAGPVVRAEIPGPGKEEQVGRTW